MDKKKAMKKEILLDIFEVLKNDLVDNEDDLSEIIQKMLPIDEDMAIELWKYVFKKYRKFGSYMIMNAFNKIFGINKLAKLIVNDAEIKVQVFQYDSVGYSEVVAHFINVDDLSTANDVLELMYNNSNLSNSFAEDLLIIISPYCNKISSEGVEMLYSWAEKLTKTEKAKINVALLDYL